MRRGLLLLLVAARAHAQSAAMGGDPSAGLTRQEADDWEQKQHPGGELNLGLEYTRLLDGAPFGGTTNAYAASVHAAMAPQSGVVMTMIDITLGYGGGFLYQADLLVGPGRWFGRGGVGLVGGAGIDGITGSTIPFGMRLPIRAWAAVDIVPELRIEASVELAWIVLTKERRGDGAPFGDEWVGRLGVYIGGRNDAESDRGYFVGATVRRALDTTLVTAGFGMAISAGGGR